MRFRNREVPTFAGSDNTGNEGPDVVEIYELVDRNDAVLGTFTKAVDGSVSFSFTGNLEAPVVGRMTDDGTDIEINSGAGDINLQSTGDVYIGDDAGDGNSTAIDVDDGGKTITLNSREAVYLGDVYQGGNRIELDTGSSSPVQVITNEGDFGFKINHTWNDIGTFFDALAVDVTDTASHAFSALLLLKCGTSRFEVLKNGELVRYGGSDPIDGEILLGDSGTSTLRKVKMFHSAAVAPTVNDDSDDGFAAGATWIDTVGEDAYVCISAAVGAALWKQTTP